MSDSYKRNPLLAFWTDKPLNTRWREQYMRSKRRESKRGKGLTDKQKLLEKGTRDEY